MLPDWLEHSLIVIAALLALGLAVWLSALSLRGVRWLQRNAMMQRRSIKIANQGNVRGIFQLAARAETDSLRFRYMFNRVALPLVDSKPAAKKAALKKSRDAKQDEPSIGIQPPPSKMKPEDLRMQVVAFFQKASQGVRAVVGKGRFFASLLGTLGNLLPGRVGRSLKQKSTALQSKTQTAGTAIHTPGQRLRTGQLLQDRIQQLRPASRPSRRITTPSASGEPAEKELAEGRVAPAQPIPGLLDRKKRLEYVQTPVVMPGEALTVELRIEPVNLHLSDVYPFRIHSRQVQLPDIPARKVLTVLETPDAVVVRRISPLYLVVNYMLAAGSIVLNGALLTLFYLWLIPFIP